MPVIACPIPGCDYRTPDHDAVIVAVLLTTHGSTHQTAGTVRTEGPKLKRPTISPGGNGKDWECFDTPSPAQTLTLGNKQQNCRLTRSQASTPFAP